MASPLLWGPNNTSNNLQAAIGLSSGARLDSNGMKNYITNGQAEVDTTGWATYADAAGNVPVDGTGGTATGLTFARSTSSPLLNIASFTLTQANSTNIQGKGVSYAFTIDSSMQAQIFSISFNYNASSTFVASNGTTPPLNDGTTSTNAGNSDLEVFIYDVTNGVLVPVSPQVLTGNGTNNFQFKGIFQTSSNSTSYRLIFHVATSNANATGWTVKFDNVFVGPQFVFQGTPATDPVAYTPTITGFGSVSGVNFMSWRVGAYLFVEGTFTAGTATGTEARITLGYNGANANVTTLSTLPTLSAVGMMKGGTASSTFFTTATVTAEASKTYLTLAIDNSTNSGLSKSNGDAFTNSATYSFFAKVPITGWSSNVLMSNDADTRVVAASYALNGGNVTPGAGNPIKFDTLTYDTHGAYSASTGLFTAPVSGKYRISVAGEVTSNTCGVYVAVNGAASGYLFNANTGVASASSMTFNLKAGDTIGAYADTSSRTFISGTSTGGYVTYFTIEKISGPATIAATDSVNARYYGSSTSISGSLATIVWSTKDYDSFAGMTSGVYTVPVSGKYQVNASLLFSGTFVLNNTMIMEIQKNGSAVSRSKTYAGGAVTEMNDQISDTITCVAGDTIRIQASSGGTTPAIVSSNFDNYVSITRVGN